MTSPQSLRHVLIERVHELVEEALRLPYGASSFARREEIDWELLHLFRQIGTLSDGPMPYWIQEEARRLRLSKRRSDRLPAFERIEEGGAADQSEGPHGSAQGVCEAAVARPRRSEGKQET